MKGQKTGGREAGTPNKVSTSIADLIAAKYPDYHPVMALAEIANDKKQDINIRFHCHKEVAKYICPQLKSIEVKNEDRDIRIHVTRSIIRSPNDISLDFGRNGQTLQDVK